MEYLRRAAAASPSLALLPGAWNPPTRAHLALARAGLQAAGEVLLVLPRTFPHKDLAGPALDQRLAWLLRVAESDPRFSVALSDGGLFIEMAREAKRLRPEAGDIFLLCGSDAAERIIAWPYPAETGIEAQLREYRLLVAARDGRFAAPPRLAHAVTTLLLEEDCSLISSSEVRRRAEAGEDWAALVPASIAEEVGRVYGAATPAARVPGKP